MPFRAWLISVTIRFGLASAKMFGVERNSKALLPLLGSSHKNISCGLDGGTYVETSAGWTGSLRSKNLIRQSSVAGRVQAWMILLQRKYITISSFCSGQTCSSREVCPANGLVVNSFPNSFTTVGAAGFLMSRTSTPGWGCGQVFKPSGGGAVRRGSPIPQRLEPSVRLPTYKK